jgi:peptide/nickel transport system substrate-binding protein
MGNRPDMLDGSTVRGPRAWLCWLLLLTIIGSAAACGSDGDGDEEGSDDTSDSAEEELEPVPGGSLVFGQASETDGYIPDRNRWGASAFNVARAVYDPLTVIDTEGVAQPYLVKSIEADDVLQQWTITLRDEEIRYHNDDVMTSEHIATFLKTMQLSPLAGAAFDPVQAVAVIDEKTVVVQSEEPWGTFPAILSSQAGYMVHPDMFTGEITDPMGTGPFVYDEWVRDSHFRAVRNPNYWRPGLPYLEEIEFRPLPDPAARRDALEAGDIDILHTNTASDLVDLGADGSGAPEGFQVVLDGSAGDEQTITLNTQSGPTADLNVRRALQLATDQQALVDGLYDGFFETADGPFDESSFWWTDSGWPDPDPDEAARLVEEWEAENGPLSITLKVTAHQENLQLGQAVQEMWTNVGIDAKVESYPESEFANFLLFGEFDGIMSQYYNRSDPDEHYHFWDPKRIGAEGELSLNFPRWTNDAVGEALAAGRQLSDPDERKEHYSTVWREWAENVPYLWLYHGQWMLMASDNLHGLDAFEFPDGSAAEPMDAGAVFLTSVWRTD